MQAYDSASARSCEFEPKIKSARVAVHTIFPDFLSTPLNKVSELDCASHSIFMSNKLNHKIENEIPSTTAIGSLLRYITRKDEVKNFQPMNINFGLMPDVPIQITTNGKKRKLKGKERKEFQANRALNACDDWLKNCKIANIA